MLSARASSKFSCVLKGLLFHFVDAVHLKHPGSNYSAPVNVKRPESTAGGSAKVLKITADLTGKHPRDRKSTSEVGYAYAGSGYGTYRKAKSESGGTLRSKQIFFYYRVNSRF